MFPAAAEALSEFCGITIRQSAAGKECARESFSFDPALCVGERDRFASFEELLGCRLYPLGEAVGGRTFMAVAEDGRVFLLMEDLREQGPDIIQAIERLCQGIKSKVIWSPRSS